jgi:PII-like signaling protein
MQVKAVRIYLSEDSPLLHEIFDYLHQQKIKGATIFRGIKGFGHDGVREATIMDLHFNLPMIIEFADEPDIVNAVLGHFEKELQSVHVLSWLAEMS